MEKLRVVHEVIENREHDFYCDECEKFLGTTREFYDGYYSKLGNYEQTCYLDGQYKIKATLCDECATKKTDKIIQALSEVGYKKENY